MTDIFNNDESDFEMLSSQPEKERFLKVPEETTFKFKLDYSYSTEGKRKFGYKLKKGLDLPYKACVGGMQLQF